jgi:cytoskeletal protein CcmA (bactofilin family)
VSAVRVALLAALALALAGCDADVARFTVVTGGSLELEAGEVERGTVIVLDGLVTVPAGASVAGSVVVIDGSLAVGGRVDGDVTALAGRVSLGDGATIAGDLRIAGALDRHPGARVGGSVTVGSAVTAELAEAVRGQPAGLVATVLRIVALALGAGLLARLAPRAATNLADAAAGHPLVSGALGILALVVVLVLVVVMAFTIVLIPVSLLALALTVAALVAGWLALGTALGRAVARTARRDWSLARAATVGTLGFAVVFALMERVPLLWGIVPIVVSAVGVGAVALTGFGLRRFVPAPDDAGDACGPGA